MSVASFGPAVFAGEPIAYLELRVDAELTTEARRLTARGATDGTALKVKEFSVGTGGFDPVDYTAALPVNPDAQALHNQVFSDTVDRIARASQNVRSYDCLLESGEANNTLGEVALWTDVYNSPGDPIDGTTVCFAIGHFPLLAKNSDFQYVLRVTVAA